MLNSMTRKQSGSIMISAVIFTVVVLGILGVLQQELAQERERKQVERQGRLMANYLNAIAGFMVDQGPTAPNAGAISGLTATGPDTFVANGTDWLKDTTCGGGFPPDASYLGCNVPTNFNLFFGLGAPTVTFDYTNQPQADVTFGIVQDNGPDPITAGALVREINSHIEAAGFVNVNVFHIAAPNNADLQDANLRATIRSQPVSDVWVRRDGQSEMTGPLVTRHNNWAMIARDENGNEAVDDQASTASANLNDIFVRSADAWVSETHALAEEAFAMAAQSPQFMTETGPGPVTISKPSCPGGLTPQIFINPTIFVGGTSSEKRLIAGVRRRILSETATTWRIRLEIAWDDGAGALWRSVPPDMGRMVITTKCS